MYPVAHSVFVQLNVSLLHCFCVLFSSLVKPYTPFWPFTTTSGGKYAFTNTSGGKYAFTNTSGSKYAFTATSSVFIPVYDEVEVRV